VRKGRRTAIQVRRVKSSNISEESKDRNTIEERKSQQFR
jgi:hypothetical protein